MYNVLYYIIVYLYKLKETDWGLRLLRTYGVALIELPLAKFGVPLAGFDAFIMSRPQFAVIQAPNLKLMAGLMGLVSGDVEW